ncbi:MAG: hypothetical protein ACXVPN_10430 [Bacteroidia bacterium]
MNKIKLLLLIPAFLMFRTNAKGQNVGINATGNAPDNSAMLDVSAANKGLLIPNVSLSSTTDAATIASPATSLLVYNTNASISGGSGVGYYYNSGTASGPTWTKLLNGSSVVTGVAATAPVYSSGVSTPTISLQGTSGSVCYGTGGGSNFNAAGTSGQYLQSQGASAPVWASPKSLFSIPLTNGGSGVANNSATYDGGYIVWTTATAPGGAISMYTLLTGSFYQATTSVNFLRATGWIYTTSATGTFNVTVYKYSGIGSGSCNAQVGTTTTTGTLLGSCSVTAASTTTYAGKFLIDLTNSPSALSAGDVLVLFVQNTSGGSRTWYAAGSADFTANTQ